MRGLAAVEDVLALDFLIQHPSVLTMFIKLSDEPWPTQSIPSIAEAQSSEETLLKWKRSIGVSILAPALGRLIGRGLVRYASRRGFMITDVGLKVSDRLGDAVSNEERERLMLTARDFARNATAARERLRRSLIEEIT